MYEKLKSFLANDVFFMTGLLVLVAIISFGLGRQSAIGEEAGSVAQQSAGIIFTDAPEKPVIKTDSDPNFKSVPVVASRSGTKYHLLTCPGAKQIKEANKIFFDSIELAKAAGYTPAANCAGL